MDAIDIMITALSAAGMSTTVWSGRTQTRLYVRDHGRDLGYLVGLDRGGTGECRGITGRRGYVAALVRAAFDAQPSPERPSEPQGAPERPRYVPHPMGVACPDCRASSHVGTLIHHTGRCDLLPKGREIAHVGHPVGVPVPAAKHVPAGPMVDCWECGAQYPAHKAHMVERGGMGCRRCS